MRDKTDRRFLTTLKVKDDDMKQERETQIQIFSFGYKYGAPQDISLLFDVRFLPNPYYNEELRPFCGMDSPIRKFMASHDSVRRFCEYAEKFTLYYIDEMIKAGKPVSVAFGCTGGRHRSVYFAQLLYEKCTEAGYRAKVFHRDLGGLI